MKLHVGPRRILVGFRLVEALGQVLSGIGAYLKQRQCNWQIHCVDADEFASNLKRGTTDGALTVISPASPRLVKAVLGSGVPVVNMLHDLHPRLPSVLSDDPATGRAAARYLLGRGFRQFAFLGFNTRWSRARQQGFLDALGEAGCACQLCHRFADVADYRLLGSARSSAHLRRWVARLPKPAAVLACSDLVARSLLSACDEAQVRVPQDLAVLGVDNLVPTCELAPVPLSSVAQDSPGLGFAAARVRDRLMSTGRSPARAVLVPPGAVVGRRSTDVLAFDDEYVAAAMRVIHDRGADGITLPEVLRQVPVSRKWLDVRFKAVVGHTPAVEIRQVRAGRVEDLLLHTDLSVKQIAMRCGFSCPENMIRFFKAETGLPPQQYRARHGGMR